MYNVHQGATLLPLTLSGPDYVLDGQKLPAISASASKDSTGAIHISLVNIDPLKAQKITLNLSNEQLKSITGQILSSKKMQDYNSFTEPKNIVPQNFKDFTLNKNSITITVPPISVIVLAVK